MYCSKSDNVTLMSLSTPERPFAPITEGSHRMRVATGTVVGGNVFVTILSRAPDEPVTLSAADEDELLAAIAEIDRGEFVSASELLESPRKFG